MARSAANKSSKARKLKKQKLQRAGLAEPPIAGFSNGQGVKPATVASKAMKPKYASKGRERQPLVDPVEMVTPQMRGLVPGLGILAYKGVSDIDAAVDDAAPEAQASGSEASGPASGPASDAADFISLDFDDEVESSGGKLAQQFEKYESENSQPPKLHPLETFPAPWLDDFTEQKKSIGEHITAEVLEYMRYVSPSKEEMAKRNDCVRRLRQVTSFLWPGCSMDVFGSYAMGLYLPDADIDVVITTAGSIRPVKLRSEMYRLSARMKKTQLADRVEVIAKARVPIVKYVDKRTGLNVDIAFDQNSGFLGLDSVASWVKDQPALKPLVLVVKQFLKRRRLNEVANGGLGGYAVICLTYSLLKSHQDFGQNPQLALENVGLLLIAFFELYGYQFDYRRYAVSVRHRDGRIMKTSNPDMETQKPTGLAIEDPNDPTNNISKASFNYQSVERSFGLASDLLKRLSVAWRELPAAQRPKFSFLAPLLKYDRRTAVSRDKIDLETALKPTTPGRLSSSEQAYVKKPVKTRYLPKKPKQTTEEASQSKKRPLQRRNSLDSEPHAASSESEPRPSYAAAATMRPPINSEKTESAAHMRGDPFQAGSHQSSSDISDVDDTPARAAKSAPHGGGGGGGGPHGKPNPKKAKQRRRSVRSEEDDEDADSRTKLTSTQRRQFWKRKGELPGETADPEI